MCFTRKYFKDNRFVLTRICNGANDDKLKEHVIILTEETKDLGPFVELADARAIDDLSGFSKSGIAAAAAYEFDRQPYKRDKLAILVSSSEAAELASIYQAVSVYFRYDVRVFFELLPAIQWLGVVELLNDINNYIKE